MGDIYKKVTRVRVWLGEQDESNALVCEYFEKVAGFGGHWKDEQSPEDVALDLARKWPRLTRSMVDFFFRSWFTRAWPVQEVTLPDPDLVRVICGDTCLSLYSLRMGWDVLKKLKVLPASASVDQAVSLQFYLADAIALKRGVEIHEPGHRRTGRTIGQKRAYQSLLTGLSQFSFTAGMNAMRFKSCKEAKTSSFLSMVFLRSLRLTTGFPSRRGPSLMLKSSKLLRWLASDLMETWMPSGLHSSQILTCGSSITFFLTPITIRITLYPVLYVL